MAAREQATSLVDHIRTLFDPTHADLAALRGLASAAALGQFPKAGPRGSAPTGHATRPARARVADVGASL